MRPSMLTTMARRSAVAAGATDGPLAHAARATSSAKRMPPACPEVVTIVCRLAVHRQDLADLGRGAVLQRLEVGSRHRVGAAGLDDAQPGSHRRGEDLPGLVEALAEPARPPGLRAPRELRR